MTYRRLLILAFLFNGFLMVGMKAVDGFKLGQFIAVLLYTQYTVGCMMSIPAVVRAKKPIGRTSLWVGMLAGISSAIGMTASIVVVGKIPGYKVFPIIQGGTLLAVVFIGRLVFKERIGTFGVAGIIAGIAAIVMLTS